MNRLNIGCGKTPTKGWRNLDNSPSLLIANFSSLVFILNKLNLINNQSIINIKFFQKNNIEWADATRKIPAETDTVEVIYTSHMLEHLDCLEAASFLKEARRVLQPDGVIRIAIPDLKMKINKYIHSNDADMFIESIHMCVPRPRTICQKLRVMFVGPRHHQWMYDEISLSKLLIKSGFKNPITLKAGETTINNSGFLDLSERSEESVYVEAKK